MGDFCFLIIKSVSLSSNLNCILLDSIEIVSSRFFSCLIDTIGCVNIIDEILLDDNSCFFSVIASCLSNDTNNDSLFEYCRRLFCSLERINFI